MTLSPDCDHVGGRQSSALHFGTLTTSQPLPGPAARDPPLAGPCVWSFGHYPGSMYYVIRGISVTAAFTCAIVQAEHLSSQASALHLSVKLRLLSGGRMRLKGEKENS